MFEQILTDRLEVVAGGHLRGIVGMNAGVGQGTQTYAPYVFQLAATAPATAGTVVKYQSKLYMLGDTIIEYGSRRMRMFEVTGPVTWLRPVAGSDTTSGLATNAGNITVSESAYYGAWRAGGISDAFNARNSRWTVIGPAALAIGDIIDGLTINYVDHRHEGISFAEAR